MVIVGADVHKRTHTFVAVDDNGRRLGEKTLDTTSAGRVSTPIGAEAAKGVLNVVGTIIIGLSTPRCSRRDVTGLFPCPRWL